MSNNWDDFSTQTSVSVDRNEGKAPLHWLALGVIATLVLMALFFIFPPQGDFTIVGGLIFWFLSMVAYLLPFWIFVDSDLKIRSTSNYYYSNPKTISTLRGFYLAFGIFMSLVFIYGVADELSRILNTVN